VTRQEARATLGLPPHAFVVGAMSRLASSKGVAVLIEAASLVPEPGQDLVVIVGGSGPERDSLERLAKALGAPVRFFGHVSDTTSFLAAMDVFVLPSSLEGFGLTIVEAAFAGVPTIGTNIDGIRDTIQDGVTGVLVPVDDAAALAAAIRQLRGDSGRRDRLGANALARARDEFTLSKMIDRYVRVLSA